jgi:antitoxin (DNA-binding transcriptional repressor) of toxin-antitoxin stability system
MKETTLGQLAQDIRASMKAAQSDRLLITQDGKPVAVVYGIENKDQEDARLETSDEFWRMIEERRHGPATGPMVSLADFEKELRETEGDMGHAMHCTITYHGDHYDPNGMPDPWFHYLVIASPGPTEDSGIASIVPLVRCTAQTASEQVFVKQGGPLSAISKAENLLDRRHPGLKKRISELKP